MRLFLRMQTYFDKGFYLRTGLLIRSKWWRWIYKNNTTITLKAWHCLNFLSLTFLYRNDSPVSPNTDCIRFSLLYIDYNVIVWVKWGTPCVCTHVWSISDVATISLDLPIARYVYIRLNTMTNCYRNEVNEVNVT